MQAGFRIGPAAPGQQREALRLAFADLEPEERAQHVAVILSQPDAGGPSEGLLVATHDADLVGAVFLQIMPGRVGTIRPPRVTDSDDSAVASELLQAACDQLGQRGACMVQCLLREVPAADLQLLTRAGFEHFADLYYLVSVSADFPQSPPSTELVFEPYASATHARFAAVVEATYEGTQDCPRLNGLRAIDDVLASYRGSGEFDPNRWLLVSHAGREVGCLLLADYAEQGNYELVYMGVVPQARGHAWGKAIAQYAQWRAHVAGRERLVLAADASNAPALRMYGEVGFRAWDRRSVLVRIFAGSS